MPSNILQVSGYFDHALPVEIAGIGVVQSNVDPDHWRLPHWRAICLTRTPTTLRLHSLCVQVPQWHPGVIPGRLNQPRRGQDVTPTADTPASSSKHRQKKDDWGMAGLRADASPEVVCRWFG